MNIEEIKQYLDANQDNEEVEAFVNGLRTVTLDDIKKLATENEDLSKWIASEKDRHFNKGLETWKEKTLPGLIDEEVKKRNPEKTSEQIELENLRLEIGKMQKEKQRESMRAMAKDHAIEQKLPHALVDFFVSDDEESTKSNLETLGKVWNESLKGAVGETFKQNGREPHRSTQPKQTNNPFAKESFNLTEQSKLMKENPVLAQQYQQQANKGE